MSAQGIMISPQNSHAIYIYSVFLWFHLSGDTSWSFSGCLLNSVFPSCPPLFSSQELSLKVQEVETLLIDLILDQRLHGKIDQIEGFLLLEGSKQTTNSRRQDAMERWSNALRSLNSHLVERVEH